MAHVQDPRDHRRQAAKRSSPSALPPLLQLTTYDCQELDSQGYVCPQCRKSFTPLDAAQILDPYRGCFVCDVCNTELVNNENEEEVRGSKDRMQRLVEQTRVIRDLLKKMDDVVLPRCVVLSLRWRGRKADEMSRFDVIKWLELNGPAGGTAVAEGPTVGPSGAVRIELAGDDDEAIMKAKREADAIEKRCVPSLSARCSHSRIFDRAANQLPSWIAQSTVSGEASTAHLEAQPTLPSTSSKADIKPSVSLLNPTETSSAELDLDAYYASLASAPLSPSRVALPPSRADSPLFSPLPIPSAVKEEEGSEDEFDEIGVAVQDAFGADEVPKGSGKRSRDEVDSGWEEGGDEWEGAGKKARVEEEVERAPEEDEDEEEFDEVGGEGDPNPLIAVGDKMVPFDEVGEELQAAMVRFGFLAASCARELMWFVLADARRVYRRSLRFSPSASD